ncbi:hypothetical protein PRIPAC_85618 [Pristionchus pacificus]|uniref:JmjC domain-containing protein n=1 Tax=Pristionchus pacificus TaxID=54126 RepID=A0A2A6BU64_PRIPA|nr:hypothetical protein PRIPAC_85618 [Pristionchus pacificus]|eukprot:PDM69522.1 hypothetical protein PRIPAC_44618 [Pristionchus pacificus]
MYSAMTPSTRKRRASKPSSSATRDKKKKMDIPVPSDPKSTDKKSDKMKCRVCHGHHPQRNQFAYRRIEFDRTELAWLDWINCVACKCDFHLGCVGKQPFEKMLIASFVCQACEKNGKRTTNKTPEELGEISNGKQIGSQQWINTTLQTKKFEDVAVHRDQERYGLIEMKDGEEFSAHFDPKKDWRAIYLIKSKEGLGLQVPTAPFGMDELIKLMKGVRILLKMAAKDWRINDNNTIAVDPTQWLENVIDVTAQITTRMSLDRFGELFNNTYARERIYNILSLEYSRTGLADVVIPPEIYRTVSLADRFWPLGGDSPERCDPKHEASRPAVERFVLIGMGGSFTDFHIDFGGSSVWYHVYQGQKVFYAAPPTPKNLQLFEVVIDQGSTLLIPSGYVHAVYTPVDSIVFGGNFLTLQGLQMQIEIQKMDTRRELGDLFGYPSFDTVMFYTALTLSKLLNEFCEQRASGLDVNPDYLEGAETLVEYLKEEKEVASNKKKPSKFARGMTKKDIAERLEQAVVRAKEEFTKSNGQSTKGMSEMMMIETFEKDEDVEQVSKKMKEGETCLLPKE